MKIGITPVHLQQTTPVGPHQKAVSQSTTHVHQVGVFLTEVVTVYGQRQDLIPQHTTVQIKGCLSASHHLPQLGILLRVIAPTALAVSAVSVATATIGLPLLTVTATSRTTCTSPAMATSIRLTTTIARAASQSAVSKNNS